MSSRRQMRHINHPPLNHKHLHTHHLRLHLRLLLLLPPPLRRRHHHLLLLQLQLYLLSFFSHTPHRHHIRTMNVSLTLKMRGKVDTYACCCFIGSLSHKHNC